MPAKTNGVPSPIDDNAFRDESTVQVDPEKMSTFAEASKFAIDTTPRFAHCRLVPRFKAA